MKPATLIDLDRYPVLDLDGAGAPMVHHHAAELRRTGVSILPGFLRAAALPGLVAECDELASTQVKSRGNLRRRQPNRDHDGGWVA